MRWGPSGAHLVDLILAELLPHDLGALEDAEQEGPQDDRAQLRLAIGGRGGSRRREARYGGKRVGTQVVARPQGRGEPVAGVERRLLGRDESAVLRTRDEEDEAGAHLESQHLVMEPDDVLCR